MLNITLWSIVGVLVVGSFILVLLNFGARIFGYYKNHGGCKEYLKRFYVGIAGVGFGVFLAWLFIGLGWMQSS